MWENDNRHLFLLDSWKMATGLSPNRMMKEIISSLMYLLTSRSTFLHSSIQHTPHNIKTVKMCLALLPHLSCSCMSGKESLTWSFLCRWTVGRERPEPERNYIKKKSSKVQQLVGKTWRISDICLGIEDSPGFICKWNSVSSAESSLPFKKQFTSREFSPATEPDTGQWWHLWLLTDILLLAFLSPLYLKETPEEKKQVVVGKSVSCHLKSNKSKCGWMNPNFESMGPRCISRTDFFKP